MCSSGRIPGVKKIGRTWCIPIGVSKPEDERVIAGNYRDARRKAKGEVTQRAKDTMKFFENITLYWILQKMGRRQWKKCQHPLRVVMN